MSVALVPLLLLLSSLALAAPTATAKCSVQDRGVELPTGGGVTGTSVRCAEEGRSAWGDSLVVSERNTGIYAGAARVGGSESFASTEGGGTRVRESGHVFLDAGSAPAPRVAAGYRDATTREAGACEGSREVWVAHAWSDAWTETAHALPSECELPVRGLLRLP